MMLLRAILTTLSTGCLVSCMGNAYTRMVNDALSDMAAHPESIKWGDTDSKGLPRDSPKERTKPQVSGVAGK